MNKVEILKMKSKRPNIVFILSDDQGAWAMRCAGNDDVITPNLDRLAEEGIRFENFFCVSPVCSPARASLLTGRIPSQHGVHDWILKGNIKGDSSEGGYRAKDQPIEYLADLPGYTEYLALSGYNCGISGKWHLGDSGKPQKGFNYWYTHAFGGGNYYDYQVFEDGELKTENNYVTYQFTEKALEYIDSHKNDENPFYLSVHYTAPHSPWDKKEHPEDIWQLYDNCRFKSTPDLPLHQWQRHFFTEDAPYTPERRREYLQGYYTAITAMDNSIGNILDKLETEGLRENTVIIFTADNGMCMGHHGVWGKGNGTFPLNMYDSSVKVPFIISCPEKLKQGVIEENLYSHYDVFPTLLDYLGIANPLASELPGKSFAPLLRGETSCGNENVVIFDEYGPVRMIRDKEWKYIHRFPYGPHELYNLAEDPEETKNLINEVEFADQADKMRGTLQDWFNKYVNPERDGSHEPVTGDGQINLAGPANKGRHAFAQDQAENLNAALWNRYYD
jgi:arylsulfatase A-like enzyme